MAFKLNWRTASLGHLRRQLGFLYLGGGGGGGGVKQLISFSSSTYYNPSSWSLLSRGITTINSCNYCLTNFPGDQIKPRNHPLLSSRAPCLLIPFPMDKDDDHEVFAAAIAEGKCREEIEGFPEYCFFSLDERKLVALKTLNNVRRSKCNIPLITDCIGSCHGWLAYIDRRDDYVLGDDYGLYLTNPLITPVPPTIRIPALNCIPKKFVMSSPPPLSASGDDDDCILMAIDFENSLARKKFGDSCCRGKLDYNKLEEEEEEEEEDDDDDEDDYNYDDIVYSPKDQLFYSIHSYGQIEAWDLHGKGRTCKLRIPFDDSSIQKPDFPEYDLKLRENALRIKFYLVVDPFSADILSLHRYGESFAEDGTIIEDLVNWKGEYYFRTLRFEVYRLNVANKSWDYVECLGDRVVFVGDNQSFMVSAHDFPPGVLMPNSIYFTFDYIYFTDKVYPKEADMGIYNLRDSTITPIFPSHYPLNRCRPVMWFNPSPRLVYSK